MLVEAENSPLLGQWRTGRGVSGLSFHFCCISPRTSSAVRRCSVEGILWAA